MAPSIRYHVTIRKNKDLCEVYGDILYFKEKKKIKVKNNIYNSQPFIWKKRK